MPPPASNTDMQAVQWSRPAPPAPPERGSPIFGLRPISLDTSTSVSLQQAALVQVVEQGREGPIELRQQPILQAIEVVAVRVPAAAALAQVSSSLSPFQKTVTNGTPASTSRRASSIDMALMPAP